MWCCVSGFLVWRYWHVSGMLLARCFRYVLFVGRLGMRCVCVLVVCYWCGLVGLAWVCHVCGNGVICVWQSRYVLGMLLSHTGILLVRYVGGVIGLVLVVWCLGVVFLVWYSWCGVIGVVLLVWYSWWVLLVWYYW